LYGAYNYNYQNIRCIDSNISLNLEIEFNLTALNKKIAFTYE